MLSKRLYFTNNLIEAIRTNDFEATRALINERLLGKMPSGKELSNLLLECADSRIAKLLIERGADVEAEDPRGRTPLGRCPSIEMAKVLIKAGACVNTVDNNENTVLNEAASKGRSDLVALLVENRAISWYYCKEGNQFFGNLFHNYEILLGT